MDSTNFCASNGWKIASFHSEEDINGVKDKVSCNAYIGATSDGNGNWEWIDNSNWWEYGNSDGLQGETETKIVWQSYDKSWSDWGIGEDEMGVICKNPGYFQSLVLFGYSINSPQVTLDHVKESFLL